MKKLIVIILIIYTVLSILAALNAYFPMVQQYYFKLADSNVHSSYYVHQHIPRLYRSYPMTIHIHSLFALLMVGIWPLQFSSKIRKYHRKWHVALGTLFFISAFVVGATALMISYLIPYAGRKELFMNGLTVSVFFICLAKSLYFISQKNIAQHKRWIIRALSLSFGIISQRILFVNNLFTNIEFSAQNLFVLSGFLGFFGNLAIVELYIVKIKNRSRNQ